jgi:hypothetical protein
MVMQKVSREDKARLLVAEGRIRLHPGTGAATAYGSDGAVYSIHKGEGCSCPDRARRGPGCKHEIGCAILCQEYRACAAQARRGETVRPSVNLLRALGWEVGEQSPAPPLCHHGDPAPCHWCREEAFERDLATRCHSCGELLINGYCPREASEGLERKAA